MSSGPNVAHDLKQVLEAKNPDGTPKYTFVDFQATFPPMMISLLAHVPFEDMAPEAQELVVLAMGQLGLEIDSTKEQFDGALKAYVEKYPPNQELLAEIQGLLLAAATKSEDAIVEASRKMSGEKLSAPKLGEEKPEGSVDVRKLAPKIRM